MQKKKKVLIVKPKIKCILSHAKNNQNNLKIFEKTTWLVVNVGCPSIRLKQYLYTIKPETPFSAQYLTIYKTHMVKSHDHKVPAISCKYQGTPILAI